MCGEDYLPRERPCVPVSVSPEPSGDSLWLSMALPALGLDPWSLLGLFLFQLLLLLLPTATTGGGGQEPLPRVRYSAGECLMARKRGDGHREPEGPRREGGMDGGRGRHMEKQRDVQGETASERLRARNRSSDRVRSER